MKMKSIFTLIFAISEQNKVFDDEIFTHTQWHVHTPACAAPFWSPFALPVDILRVCAHLRSHFT